MCAHVCVHACVYVCAAFGGNKRKSATTFALTELLVIILLPVFWTLRMGGILELPNRNVILHKCSNMLIRYKIIHKNSAWLYVRKKTINFVYHGAHIAQDNGNQTKLHIGESQGKTLVFECLN